MKGKILYKGIVCILIFFYGASATDKMCHFSVFSSSLRAMGFAGNLPGIIATTVTVIESVIALWLCVGWRVFGAFVASGLLLSVYCVYLGFRVAFYPASATLFSGILIWLPWQVLLILNFGFVIISFFAAAYERTPYLKNIR